jgi:hypothetical protein
MSAVGKASSNQVQHLNNLDNQIMEILLAAERTQCPTQHENNWSIAIYNQSLLCKYWSVVMKSVRNKIDTFKRSL